MKTSQVLKTFHLLSLSVHAHFQHRQNGGLGNICIRPSLHPHTVKMAAYTIALFRRHTDIIIPQLYFILEEQVTLL